MNKADRELLELAAKSIGLLITKSDDNGWFYVSGMPEGFEPEWGLWNPLEDDGDAVRLAAKLRIDLSYQEANGHVLAHPRHKHILFTAEDYHAHPDVESATRRAIVRAAALIGEAML